MSRGRQIPFHNIRGGMISDRNAMRIPNNSFQKLVNMEYDEQGVLRKSNGYDLEALAVYGEIRDIRKIENYGYLIASDKVRFVSDLTAEPPVTATFSVCRSKFFEDGKGQYFYVSYDEATGLNELRKWFYSSGGGYDIKAGIVNIANEPSGGNGFAGMSPLETWHCGSFDSDNDDATFTLLSVAVVENNHLGFKIGVDHRVLRSKEKFTKICVPLKTCTINTVGQKLSCKLQVLNSSGSTLREYVVESSVLVTGDDWATFTFAEALELPNPDYYTKIKFYFSLAKTGVEDTVVFYRARPWAIDDRDSYGDSWVNYVHYTDREPEVAFMISNAGLVDGSYKYSVILEDENGIKGTPTVVKQLVWPFQVYVAGVTWVVPHSWDLNAGLTKEILEMTNAYLANPKITHIILCGTLSDGEDYYEIARLYRADAGKYSSADYPSLLEHFTAAGAPTENKTVVPPSTIIVTTDSPVVAVDQDYTNPTDYNPLGDSLFEFKEALWCIARVLDSTGARRNFIRRSDVNRYDRWNVLDELTLPTEPIEALPLREDMAIAFSSTKGYRIDPDGTSYTWLKISDTGMVGLPEMIASDVVQASPRLSCVLGEAIFWVNKFGLNTFDGSAASHEPRSYDVLSWFTKFIAARGILIGISREKKIYLSATFDGHNYVMVIDTIIKAMSLQSHAKRITCMPEDLGYWGLDGGIALKSSGWFEEGSAIESLIHSKRFASNDLNRIRTYYFGVIHKISASGSISIEFTFSTGKVVTKTIDISGAKVGDIKISKIEIYGEGEWFEFKITHTDDDNLEILEYVIGAAPIDLAFMEAANA